MAIDSQFFFKAVAASLLACSGAAAADDRNQVERGHRVAHEICAACHAVERHQTRSTYQAAPAFDQIADAPAMTRLALRVALRSSHRVMPNIRLTESQRADVIAYIMTLKRERPRSN